MPLIKDLEIIREEFGGKPITITSAYRTESYNKKVGGATNSQHKQGWATDIKVKGVPARRVARKILELIREGRIKQGGVGSYNSFTHYDHRGVSARWGFR